MARPQSHRRTDSGKSAHCKAHGPAGNEHSVVANRSLGSKSFVYFTSNRNETHKRDLSVLTEGTGVPKVDTPSIPHACRTGTQKMTETFKSLVC